MTRISRAKEMNGKSRNTRLWLAVACFWPLAILALFGASSSGNTGTAVPLELAETNPGLLLPANARFSLRNALDRVDLLGYGPTHPRVAIVMVVSSSLEADMILTSIESVLANTDYNRLFVITVVMDGFVERQYESFVDKVRQMESGTVPHWHGLRMDRHDTATTDDKIQHGRKIHFIWNEGDVPMGVGAARRDAVQFISVLAKTHEEVGLKSPQEDLILLLLRTGCTFVNPKWLPAVTSALIVPPPIIPDRNPEQQNIVDVNQVVAMKMANAVSFQTLGNSNKATSFTVSLEAQTVDAKTEELNESNGLSYSTPALEGAATAMRLDTYVNLPCQDDTLVDEWSVNLDLALNLWLCGDGIDMIQDVQVMESMSILPNANTGAMKTSTAARFATAWMDERTAQKFLQAYDSATTQLEWSTYMAKARQDGNFPADLPKKCRSFVWYIENVNPSIAEVLTQILPEEQSQPPQPNLPITHHEAQQHAVAIKEGLVKQGGQQPAPLQDPIDEQLQEEVQAEGEQRASIERQNISPPDEAKRAADSQRPPPVEDAEGAVSNINESKPSDGEVTEPGQRSKQQLIKISDTDNGGSTPEERQQQKLDRASPSNDEKNEQTNEQQKRTGDKATIEQGEANVAEQRRDEQQQQQQREDPGVGEVADRTKDIVSDPAQDTRKKPSKPLCDECLEIVQRAKPVDITYVDVSGGHKEHPHLGALDEHGNPGYVIDETALRRNPPEFEWAEPELTRACRRRDNNYRMLHERVFVDFEAHEAKEKSGVRRDKIFCLVYTIEQGHPRVPNIRETWGPKCDGFIVASNKTVESLGTVNILHEGPEEYNNIWQKVRSMWSYVYDNYYEKYDWFHIGGDDLFLIVENLRLYLESEEIRTAANGGIYLPDENSDSTIQTPLFLGRRFAYWGDMENIFISGGSGYTMNKAALKTLVVDGFPQYFPRAHTFSEDTMVAKVFRKFGVYPYNTQDENGSERYMPFLPGHHWGYHMPKNKEKDWYAAYSIDIKEGPEHCSERSVAFHYVKDLMMKRLFALLYNRCPAGTLDAR